MLADLIVPTERLFSGEELGEGPCLFVLARDSGQFHAQPDLPPVPVIAIGEDSAAPDWADAVVPDEAVAQLMLDRISDNPKTAAVIVDLLRVLPQLSLEQGLVAESLAYGLLQGSEEYAAWLAARAPTDPLAEGQVRAKRQDTCLELVLDRPAADNAIDRAMRDQLAEMLALAAIDPTIERVVLRGAGRSFSLGADLGEFGTTRDPATAHAIRRRTLPARNAAACANKLEVHVQGACVGAGLEIAAFARRIVAGPRAWFQLPELAMGVLPGAGGCVSLTRRIGRQKTALMILSGRRITAREALDWGLVDELSANDGGADEV